MARNQHPLTFLDPVDGVVVGLGGVVAWYRGEFPEIIYITYLHVDEVLEPTSHSNLLTANPDHKNLS